MDASNMNRLCHSLRRRRTSAVATVCPQVVGGAWRGPLVHGLLHLLGYDHGAEMEAREAALA
jgi:hypothetical protein